MNFLENVCCICLKEISESNIENFVSLDDKNINEVSQIDKLINIIPEINNENFLQLIIDKKICNKCENNIESLYEFKIMCMKNRLTILNTYDNNIDKFVNTSDNENIDITKHKNVELNDTIPNDINDESYENKPNNEAWKLNKLTEAILSIETGGIKTLSLASKKYNIPKAAIARRIKNDSKKRPHTITFNYEHHKNLNLYIIKKSRLLYNFTEDNLKEFFYYFIKTNDIFNEYFKTILTKNRSSINRNVDGTINRFYDNVYKTIVENNVSPSNIFNVNKFTISYENLLRKRKNCTRSIENETLTSFIGINSAGDMIPLVSTQKIRKHTRFVYENKNEVFYSQNVELIFLRYLEIFVYYTNVSGNRIVLLVDQQCFNVRLYDFCRKNNIVVVCIPFEMSQLQPINLKFINKIKYNYGLEYENYFGNNIEEMSVMKSIELLNKVCKEVLTKDKIIDSFKTTGIHPFDKNSVDIDFYASISK